MTDIAVETYTFLPAERPWLLFEAEGNSQPVPTTSGIIDFSTFTANTHYPNGFIPSGMALGIVTSTGRLAPYSHAASDGTQTCVGLLYNSTPVNAALLTKKVAVALIDCFAIVSQSKLPASNGVDSYAIAALPLVKFRA